MVSLGYDNCILRKYTTKESLSMSDKVVEGDGDGLGEVGSSVDLKRF